MYMGYALLWQVFAYNRLIFFYLPALTYGDNWE